MSAITALQTLQNDLIRKTLNGSTFIAPISAATVDESTLFDPSTGDLATLPTGFHDLGYLTDAGASFNRAVTNVDVTSWQSLTPTRSDLTADTATLQVVCQETNLYTLGLMTGADESSIVAGTNGVVRVDKPAQPVARYYRLLSIAVDETDAGEIVLCRYLPRAKPTAFGKQDYAKANEIQYDVTFTGYVDSTLGTPESFIFGGAGWLARLAAMGITSTPSVPVISGAVATGVTLTTLPAAGGTLVQINGHGFTGTVSTTGVKFAGTNATTWDVVNDSTIVAVAPAHSAGSGTIVVTNATGASTTGPSVTYV